MKRRLPIVILLLVAAAILIWWLVGRSESERYLSGYIEGEELYLASPVSGTVQAIAAQEGARVTAGTALFSIDPATLSAQGDQARAEIAAAPISEPPSARPPPRPPTSVSRPPTSIRRFP